MHRCFVNENKSQLYLNLMSNNSKVITKLHVSVHICVYVCVCVCTYVHLYVCYVSVHMFVCSISMSVCVYVFAGWSHLLS